VAQQRYSRRHQALMAILIEARAAIGKTQLKVSADMKKSAALRTWWNPANGCCPFWNCQSTQVRSA